MSAEEKPVEEPKQESREIKKEEPKSKNDLIKELIKNKIDDGFPLTDNNKISELRKTIKSELSLPNGYNKVVKDNILKIMQERKLSFEGIKTGQKTQGFDVKLNNILGNDNKPETTTEITKVPQTQNEEGWGIFGNKSNHVTPGTQQQQPQQVIPEPPKQPMSEKQKAAQVKIVESLIDKFLVKTYIALGIVEGSEEEQKEENKPMPLKQFKEDAHEFAGELNDLLIEFDVRLPKVLRFGGIAISAVVLFIVPVIKMKMFNDKSEVDGNFDKELDDVKI